MTPLAFREAVAADLPAIVAMLAEDDLGRGREDASPPLKPAYRTAFDAIAADPNQNFVVAERDGRIVGFLQVSFIPGLSRQGAWRGNIESVRVAASERGRGLGAALMRHAIGLCRARGCRLVQLTSDKRREEAHRFYGRLGFAASHEGFKLAL
jgi:ribosomal protein S18 acetylase RimI-like enzyme